MSSTTEVPIPADLSARYVRTPGGRNWLARLPELIRGNVERWGLDVDLVPGEMPWNGHGAIVIPVVRGQEPAVLKVAYPHDEARVERQALTLWNGRGAVRLLESDEDSCSMLLQRLDAFRSLQTVPMDEAREAWAAVVGRLSVTPDLRSEWFELNHIAARAEQWSDDLPAEWERLGRPFPRWLLEAALEVCQVRGAVGRRAGHDVLVHTDLHYLNILAVPGANSTDHGTRYAAIDPQPMIGEAEFAVAPLLWNRIRDLPASDPESALRQRCTDFSLTAGLDPEAARQWSLTREVDNALSYAATPGHEGDMTRSLWVASTLAGQTLGNLPHAHGLPEPGDDVRS